ncbi:MAG: hypothetical protein DSY42_07555 [Aquifex sp.]|nr:MAG: hypothetical protein DSY42_07555 [Aquifex sp.]
MKGLFKVQIKYLRKQRFRLIIGKRNKKKNYYPLEIGREVGERWEEGGDLYQSSLQPRKIRNYTHI